MVGAHTHEFQVNCAPLFTLVVRLHMLLGHKDKDSLKGF